MKLMRKDVAAALELARALDVPMPVHETAGERWASSSAELPDDADFNRIVELE